MRLNGLWIGWGLGDNSAKDFTVRDFKAFARSMYRSYMGDLADTNMFDQQLYDALVQMQDRLAASGRLRPGTFIRGVLDLETKYASGFKARPPAAKPIIFTVEGHLSDMFIGPCAYVASTLESQGVCHWKPIYYNNGALPFDNASGVNELVHQLNLPQIDGPPGVLWPFPDDLPFGILGFSQGAIVTGKTWLHNLRPAAAGTRLAARRDHLKRAISFGDPYREKDVIADWVPDAPGPGTQGISDERMDNTPPFWKVHSRHGDLYSENPDNEAGLYRTSIYKIAAENSWSGGPAGMLARIIDLLTPMDDILPVAQAILGGILFLGNMSVHGGYNLDPCVEWMRGVAA